MRLAALTVLLIGNVLASQVHAEEIATQPLTRADCGRAGMTWNDTAKVCLAAQGLEAFVEALFAQRTMSQGGGNQPLTRQDCDSGDMTWNDAANVCGVAAQAAEAMSEPQDAQPQNAQPMPTTEVAVAVGQPLTRQDCDSSGMTWNDAANVCGVVPQAAEAMSEPQPQDTQPMPTPEVAVAVGQPLTRQDCDSGDMTWNDAANVCGVAAQAAEAMSEPQDAQPQNAQPMPTTEVAVAVGQPLTRQDCDSSGMTWNDAANVCGVVPQAAEAMSEPQPQDTQPMPTPEVAVAVGQPLTRQDCDSGGMTWNDAANVCGVAAQAAEAMSEPQDAQPQDAQPMPTTEVAVAVGQPLTRQDCDSGGMTWNDAANVCGVVAQAAEAMSSPGCAAPGGATNATPEVAVAVGQPLTRQDCDSGGMTWNDAANVCGVAAQAAEAMSEPQDAQPQDTQPMPTPEVAVAVGQPLTRQDCDSGGMTWNDAANVCGVAAQAVEPLPQTVESATQTNSEETSPIPSTVLINIDKATQTMTVLLDGVHQYEWAVSTGLRGYTTPSGTYGARSMNKIWYSRQWDNAPMPHAVFFTKDGHAIHGTLDVKRLGKPASHGCVRLSPENAATLFALVEKTGLQNTHVMLAGNTPGGEGKVANKTRAKSTYRRASRPKYKNYYADSFPQRPRRGALFRRLFGG